MAQKLSKFHSRAPRYVLRPSDESWMRFAYENDSTHSFTTRFINISLTGLAFITHKESAPQLGDRLKIEVPTKDGSTIAWWAEVKRIEEFDDKKWYLNEDDFQSDSHVMVGVSFEELPSEHLNEIKVSIDEKFEQIKKEFRIAKFKYTLNYTVENIWKFLIIAGVAAATFMILWMLSRPTANYDSEKGSYWGQRFNIFGD